MIRLRSGVGLNRACLHSFGGCECWNGCEVTRGRPSRRRLDGLQNLCKRAGFGILRVDGHESGESRQHPESDGVGHQPRCQLRPAGADGVGAADEINCVPSCASGARQTYPVVVHAANPISPGPPCPGGVEFYRDLIIAYPNGMPRGFDPNDSNLTNYNGSPPTTTTPHLRAHHNELTRVSLLGPIGAVEVWAGLGVYAFRAGVQ
jgi:hypothetical protein